MNWLFTVAYVLLGIYLTGVFWTLLLATSSLATAEVPINVPRSPPAFESGKYSMPLPCPSCISALLRHHCGARRWLHSRGHRCHPDKQLATPGLFCFCVECLLSFAELNYTHYAYEPCQIPLDAFPETRCQWALGPRFTSFNILMVKQEESWTPLWAEWCFCLAHLQI